MDKEKQYNFLQNTTCLNIIVETHWGFSINVFAGTKSRAALRLIPPTTAIGAIAYPLAKLMNWTENEGVVSSAEKIRPIFKSVHTALLDGSFVVYAEITKIFSYKKREKRIISDAAAVQKVYAQPGTKLGITYMIDKGRARNILGDDWLNTLKLAAWSITRLGAKETMVNTIEVTAGLPEIIETQSVNTRYTFPITGSEKSIEGDYVTAEVIDWRKSEIGKYRGAPTIIVGLPFDPEKFVPSIVKVVYPNEIRVWKFMDDYYIPFVSG